MASVKSRRKPSTPRSQVRAALKRDKYTCQDCGVKQSRKKGKEVYVEVHHCEGILNWERLLEHVYRHLLCDPKLLETLCKRCHEKQ
jgi:5-methylcytosine-specific restriction endonuclease McrA